MKINPQAFLQQIMNNSGMMKNPVIKNAIQLYRNGNMDELNKLAENLCKEHNTSMEQIKGQIINQFKIM